MLVDPDAPEDLQYLRLQDDTTAAAVEITCRTLIYINFPAYLTQQCADE